MGSSIFRLIAEAVLQRLERKVFADISPKFWKRYVDDTFMINQENQLPAIHHKIIWFSRTTSSSSPQQHELRSSTQQAFTWSRRWHLPLNASKTHHLSIGGSPELRKALSEEAQGKSLQKCEQINDLGTTVNSAFTPSANVLTAANNARE